eukprot:jgi/Bigna1/76514/fgenesh1_pg.41_\
MSVGGARKKARTSLYSWEQSYDEFLLRVELPAGMGGKQVCSNILHRSMTLAIGGKSIIKGKFCGMVDADECTWSIEDGFVEVILIKSNASWWPGLIEGEVYVPGVGNEDRKKKKRQQQQQTVKKEAEGKRTQKQELTQVRATQKRAARSHNAPKQQRTAERIGVTKAPQQQQQQPQKMKKKKNHEDRYVTSTGGTVFGKKGHGVTNDKGNEGEIIRNFPQIEAKWQAAFEEWKKGLEKLGAG